MQIRELFESYFNELNTKITELNKNCDKEASIIVDNFYSNTLNQVEDVVNRRETKELKDELNDSLIKYLNKIVEDINSQTFRNIKNLIKNTKDLSKFSETFPIFDSKTSTNIITDYKNQLKEINAINKDYIKRIDDTFDLFLYRISISYELKNNVTLYNLLKNVIKQNKRILMDNIKDINDKFKDESTRMFEIYFENYISDSTELKDNILNKNDMRIKEYSKDHLQQFAYITANKGLKGNCKIIDEELKNLHNRILELQKSKPTKDKQIELGILCNYLISFNNTLFDKSLNTLVRMSNVIDENDQKNKQNKYNDILYKICDFEYSFEKQFMRYKKALLSKKYFVSNRISDYIEKIINEKEKQIVNLVKLSVIDLFKENVNELNSIIYKSMMYSYKIKNNCEYITVKDVERYFNIK